MHCRYSLFTHVVAAFLHYRLGPKSKSTADSGAESLHFFDLEKLQAKDAAALATWLQGSVTLLWHVRAQEVGWMHPALPPPFFLFLEQLNEPTGVEFFFLTATTLSVEAEIFI